MNFEKRIIGSGCQLGFDRGRSRDGCIRWGGDCLRGRQVHDSLCDGWLCSNSQIT